MTDTAATFPTGQPVQLAEVVDYAPGSIVSRALVQKPTGSLTLFAFDAGQALSPHTAKYDAFVTVLDGELEIMVGDRTAKVATGQTILMPANVPHGVTANARAKMLLVMIRD